MLSEIHTLRHSNTDNSHANRHSYTHTLKIPLPPPSKQFGAPAANKVITGEGLSKNWGIALRELVLNGSVPCEFQQHMRDQRRRRKTRNKQRQLKVAKLTMVFPLDISNLHGLGQSVKCVAPAKGMRILRPCHVCCLLFHCCILSVKCRDNGGGDNG